MTKLAFKKPAEAKRSRAKILLFGKPGVGKSWFSLSFPSVAYIDTEGGSTGPHYLERLNNAGGLYLGPADGSTDPRFILEQVKALVSEKHEFKTLVIDSISKVYNNMIAAEAERQGEKAAFGSEKKPAIAWMRQLISWITKADLNVVLIAHSKATWLNDKQGPDTFDAFEKIAYDLDLSIEAEKRGPNRVASVRKSRLKNFPENEPFPLDFPEFKRRYEIEYGAGIIDTATKPVDLAKPEQIAEAKALIEKLKLHPDDVSKSLEKRGASNWDDLEQAAIVEMISNLKKKEQAASLT